MVDFFFLDSIPYIKGGHYGRVYIALFFMDYKLGKRYALSYSTNGKVTMTCANNVDSLIYILVHIRRKQNVLMKLNE